MTYPKLNLFLTVDASVINNKDLFQYLSKKRNFKINGFDGKGQTSQISGHVDCIGEAVYVEDSPNNLLNANLFCKEHDLVYHGDHAKVSLYTRDGNQHALEITFSSFRTGLRNFVNLGCTSSYSFVRNLHECESNKFKDYILQNNNDYMLK